MEDQKILKLFFERSEQAIREMDAKYGKDCHRLSNNILKDVSGCGAEGSGLRA